MDTTISVGILARSDGSRAVLVTINEIAVSIDAELATVLGDQLLAFAEYVESPADEGGDVDDEDGETLQ